MGTPAYDKDHMRFFGLKLSLAKDPDLIRRIEQQPSMQGYLKQLIRDDIARNPDPEEVKPE